jgi:hypothetical protein
VWHLGHWPGLSDFTSGHIGQMYSALAAARAGGLAATGLASADEPVLTCRHTWRWQGSKYAIDVKSESQ